ncbi:hypothetical protein DXG01_013912, partial [Tephrocybe rancida]
MDGASDSYDEDGEIIIPPAVDPTVLSLQEEFNQRREAIQRIETDCQDLETCIKPKCLALPLVPVYVYTSINYPALEVIARTQHRFLPSVHPSLFRLMGEGHI